MQSNPTDGQGQPLLSVRGVQKIYKVDAGEIEAVRNLTFDLRPGELVCLVGPSGSGKTTLLKIIAGLMAPTSGEVVLEGKKVTEPPKDMAVVFQEYGRSLFPWMTVRANVELPLKNARIPKGERTQLVEDALEAVGLHDVPTSYPWQLSGGMQQRVAIARAVAYQPKVLLMDEPFAAVDAQTRADLEDLVRSVWEKLGVTILFVTHDIDESVYLGERVVVLSSSPTVVQEDIVIDLPEKRDQLTTRSLPRFVELRNHVYEQIQIAKRNKGVESVQATESRTSVPHGAALVDGGDPPGGGGSDFS
ncbi:ABC transporter ATP-binding protein [Arthrobacter caoxuetaonis]|uniref:ABC transporter ATP-binding protein n=1 Tax=Arthrobacter caoxuetaonis TaxID=2886935 RepID=A0A9X1SBX1_9MICC|nr:ABC transporter ATP-binding protein [Arthrobacter caoxuetaonis]MCC3296922.1 ABC transporter ATP-binding protein [Arthrobacter caoxuetaonis]USQ56265.1 ABC transporter ATP-binding protein [Arthrobacter caoxuetaonis]